jgi:S1-C subfamily serine protease
MKSKMYVLLLLNMTLVGSMVYFHATFPNKIEQKIVIKQEFMPPRIPLFFLYSDVRLRTTTGAGSGVIISKKLVITNNHVVTSLGKGGTLWVSWQDERGAYSHVASVIALDGARDLALVSLTGDDASFSNHVSISEGVLTWGHPITVIGSPSGHYPVPTSGTFVRRGESGGMDLIQAEIFPGNSGGPVFDSLTGHLVGLTSRLCAASRMPTADGEAIPIIATHVFLAVPSGWILDFLNENNVKLR